MTHIAFPLIGCALGILSIWSLWNTVMRWELEKRIRRVERRVKQ